MTLVEWANRECERRWGPDWVTIVIPQLDTADENEKRLEEWRDWFRANPDCLIGGNPECLGPRIR